MFEVSQTKGMQNITPGSCIRGRAEGSWRLWECLARCPRLLDAPLSLSRSDGCKMEEIKTKTL